MVGDTLGPMVEIECVGGPHDGRRVRVRESVELIQLTQQEPIPVQPVSVMDDPPPTAPAMIHYTTYRIRSLTHSLRVFAQEDWSFDRIVEHKFKPARERWRHNKSGGVYEIVYSNALLQCSTFQTIEDVVKDLSWTVYRNTTSGAPYVRLTKEFQDGRFQKV